MSSVAPDPARGNDDTGAAARAAGRPVPCLRLHTARVLCATGELGDDFEARDLAVLSLAFDYGGVRIAARARGRAGIARDPAAEAEARRQVESAGAVELSCLGDFVLEHGAAADYLVDPDGDPDGLCGFTALAVPRMRALGWQVEIAADYPFQVVTGELAATVARGEDDWFSLELGVDVDGRRVSLLPAILELIDKTGRDLGALQRRARRCVALPVGPNRYATFAPERLARIVAILCELYRGERAAPLRLGFDQGDLLDRLAEAFGGERPLGFSGDHGELRRAPATAVAVEPPAGLRATLRPYQLEGLAWMHGVRELGAGALLADDMGLGKTLQTIAVLAGEKASGRQYLPSLVVAPTSLVGNWRRELGRFAPHLVVGIAHGSTRRATLRELRRYDVVVTTYQTLVRDEDELAGASFHYLVLDEAQAVKNPRSLSHRAVRKLDARHRLALSGTPVENHLGELWSIFELLNPGMLGDAEWFAAAYRVPIEQGRDGERLAQLRARVAPYILRRTKEGVARELPAKTEIVLPVELGGGQRELYESIRVAAHAEVRAAIGEKGFGGATLTVLDALTKLRQACCDPRLVSVPSARDVTESAKLELLFELVGGQVGAGRRILVFSQFTSMLELIAAGLTERGIRYVVLTGATRDRQDVVDRFQRGEAPVFLISLKAGGTGLNLTRADTVIHYDPWWNPAAQAQATDRAHRIGQTQPVFVYRLIVAGSVEERMLRLQADKRELADGILGDGDARLTATDVAELFAPLPAV